MEQERADTVPGFTMQCGVSSRLLEYETDWYEVMEIILSRLQDEHEDKERFEVISSRDLEYWVMLEEKRYFESPVVFRAVWHPCRPCLTKNSYGLGHPEPITGENWGILYSKFTSTFNWVRDPISFFC